MSSVVIRCYSCESKIKVKAELLGKVCKCPGCGVYMIIPREGGDTLEPTAEQLQKIRAQQAAKRAAAEQAAKRTMTENTENGGSTEILIPEVEAIQPPDHPKKLSALNRYMVIDSRQMVATWENGKGWLVLYNGKLVPAKHNSEALPKVGDFLFVELQITTVENVKRLTRLRIYKLARQYAILKLASDESAILSSITGTSGMLTAQKSVLLNALKTHFMRSLWADKNPIYDFLLGNDAHSWDIGEDVEKTEKTEKTDETNETDET